MTELAPRGWPRPFRMFKAKDWSRRTSRNLPVPWVIAAGRQGRDADWTVFHDGADVAHTERLCQVCGLKMEGVILLGHTHKRKTSGAGMHPRCMALTIRFCPHYTEPMDGQHMRTVAYLYSGPGVGYSEPRYGWHGESPYTDENPINTRARAMTREQVRELAKADPMGTAR